MAKVDRIRRVRGAAAATAAGETPASIPAKTPTDELNKPDVQEKIQNPETMQVDIGGEPIILHPLPALSARAFVGLVYQIISESSGSSSAASAMGRMTGILAENQSHLTKFSEYAARATFAPATRCTIEQIQAEQSRIYNNMTFKEIGLAWDAMTVLNEVGKAIAGKK